MKMPSENVKKFRRKLQHHFQKKFSRFCQFNAAGLWKDHCELMSQDYHNHIARQGVDPNYGSISAQAERKALADIEAQLTAASRTMHDFGLQSVVDEETPLQRYVAAHPPERYKLQAEAADRPVREWDEETQCFRQSQAESTELDASIIFFTQFGCCIFFCCECSRVQY